MNNKIDLFGHGDDQGSLFGDDDNRLQPPRATILPDPNAVRLRLVSILEKARNATSMPWSEREARMWQTVFPNMAKWLPDEEGAQLNFDFEREMDRLRKAA